MKYEECFKNLKMVSFHDVFYQELQSHMGFISVLNDDNVGRLIFRRAEIIKAERFTAEWIRNYLFTPYENVSLTISNEHFKELLNSGEFLVKIHDLILYWLKQWKYRINGMHVHQRMKEHIVRCVYSYAIQKAFRVPFENDYCVFTYDTIQKYGTDPLAASYTIDLYAAIEASIATFAGCNPKNYVPVSHHPMILDSVDSDYNFILFLIRNATYQTEKGGNNAEKNCGINLKRVYD